MDIKSLIKEYGIPSNAEGTCSMENIQRNKVTFLAELSYKKFLKPNQGVIVLTSQKNHENINDIKGNTYIIVNNPHHDFIRFHNAFHSGFTPFHTGNEKPKAGRNCEIDKTARFGKNVRLGNNVKIFPHATVGSNVSIGDSTMIYSSVAVYDNVKIGSNCIIDANAVIGGEGFSTVLSKEHGAMRLKNIGGVEIGNNVEIGSSTSIDRASFLHTKICDRAIIDSHVYIGHNDYIGEDTRIAAGTTLGGTCRVGKRVWIGIGCTLKEHITIGDDCDVLINSVVISSVPAGTRVAGFYAIPNDSWMMHMKDMFKQYVVRGK